MLSLSVMLWIGPLKVSAAVAGPISETVSVITRETVAGSATRPTIDSSAIRAGNIDRTA